MARTQAGALRERVGVLTYEADADGNLAWEPLRGLWAAAAFDERANLFSSVGIGARGVTFTIRAAPWLTLHHAFSWRGAHCFLTSIVPDEASPGYWTVRAALCAVTALTAKPQDRTGRDARNRPVAVPQAQYAFEGVLTERYFRGEDEEVHRSQTRQRVLVTPKRVTLRAGDLVAPAEGAPYTVREVRELDAWKNEYIIEAQEDV